MSDFQFPFEGSSVAVAERPVVDDVAPEAPSSNQTKLFALLGVVALLVVGAVVYFFVLAGGEEAEEPVTAPKASGGSSVAPVEEPAGEEAAPSAKQKRINAKNFGRDPFKPLIVEAEEAPASGTTAPVTGASGATSVATSDSVTGSSGASQETSAPAASQPHRFKVVSVAPDNSTVTVKVDGKFYRNLKAGEVFAKFFKVRFIGGSVNDFQYGEESFKVLGTKAVSIG